METLLSGLVVLAASGLTFFAYQHPQAYERIQPALRILFGLVLIGAAAWDVSAARTWSSLTSFVAKESYGAAQAVAGSLRGAAIFVGIGAVLGWLYSELLGFLPVILGSEKPRRD
jgi:hypothetical protein